MLVNYDPERPCELSKEMAEFAQQNNLRTVFISCHDDVEGCDFYALAVYTPRIGEKIALEDKSQFIVTDVVHQTCRPGGYVAVVPTIVCHRRPE